MHKTEPNFTLPQKSHTLERLQVYNHTKHRSDFALTNAKTHQSLRHKTSNGRDPILRQDKRLQFHMWERQKFPRARLVYRGDFNAGTKLKGISLFTFKNKFLSSGKENRE